MKFSENWLREHVNPQITTTTLLAQLNQLGLEVDGVELAAPEFSGVVVAEVVSLEPHPDADKLRVCQVKKGDDTVQIVCGAKNVEAGGKYPLATIGAVLATEDGKGFKIKKAKLRGIESFGMLCSEQELGIQDSADGLMTLPQDAKVGQSVRDYLKLDDQVIEVDLTPNRSDCFCVQGVARDVAALNEMRLTPVQIDNVAASIKDVLSVNIQEPEICGNYSGRVIKGINANAATPLWMQEKLRRSGIRSLGPVVDVTNYVMLELGQPMHAFDLATLSGSIQVRLAQKNETLTLLDDSQQKLDAETLLIADDKQALAIAGVMGGLASSVTGNTQDIFLESAYFKPEKMAGVARRYGLHTDSSMRFERGVDPELQSKAIQRATQLLIEIVGGEAGPIIEENPSPEQIPDITLRQARVTRLLGFEIADNKIAQILDGLGMQLTQQKAGVWTVAVPSYRFDIRREADLIEEIVRIYGYENIPAGNSGLLAIAKKQSELERPLDKVKALLHAQNYNEVITYSFISPEMQAICDPQHNAVKVSNPISSELGVMRTNLLGGLINTLQYNISRQVKSLKVYETGLRYILQDTEIKQEKVISALCYGEQVAPQWSAQSRKIDFYDIKGELQQILGQEAEFTALSDNPILHPGQSAKISLHGNTIGEMGVLHPKVEKQLGIQGPIYYYEFLLAPILEQALPEYHALSRYQQNRRDIAIEIDQAISWSEVSEVINAAEIDILQEVQLFDVYTGENVRKGRKSFAIGLILQEFSRTLTDKELDAAVDNIVKLLTEKLGAELRQ